MSHSKYRRGTIFSLNNIPVAPEWDIILYAVIECIELLIFIILFHNQEKLIIN